MQFALVPSLKYTALTAVSARLWESNCMNFFEDVFFHSTRSASDFYLVRTEVDALVQKLPIVESLKTELSRFVHATGSDLLCWLRYHIYEYQFLKKIPVKFIWSPHGTIDLLKTADVLVRDDTLDTLDRFTLACFYCLEEHIIPLWYQLGTENCHETVEVGCDFYMKSLIDYWHAYIDAKQPLTHECDQYLCPHESFNQAVIFGNEVAFRYFFPKVCQRGRAIFLETGITNLLKSLEYGFTVGSRLFLDLVFSSRQLTEILCTALNSVNESEQLRIMRSTPKSALSLFLNWPWQHYFLKVYEYVGPFLSGEDFHYILKKLLFERTSDSIDYDYHSLFMEVWRQASDHQKQFVYNSDIIISSILVSLMSLEDRYTIDVVLKDVTAEQRKQLIFKAKTHIFWYNE